MGKFEDIRALVDDGEFDIIPITYGSDRLEFLTSRDENKSRKISKYGLMGSSVDNTKPILKRGQLLQCIDAYMNDGTVRAMVNKRVDFILGNRPKHLIEENFDDMSPEEQTAFDEIIGSQETRNLRRKINRINKKVRFHEKLTNITCQNFVLGRAAGGIERRITKEFPIFGEPIALKVLNGLRLKNPKINDKDWELEGIHYDFGETDKTNVLIPVNNLLPMCYNDHNMYDNTLWTGMSAVWPILSIAQSNGYINDEDIPESAKSLWAKYGFIYVGDKNPDSMKKFKDNAKVGTLFFHNNEKLEPKLADLHNDLSELTDVRMANMKAMCINFGFPMFLLFEDTANFATAKEVMQAFKAGILERDRTWLRGYVERYWYDPILADHLGIEDMDELANQLIKIKSVFEDVDFETRKDRIESNVQLMDKGVMLPLDMAIDVGCKPEIIERLSTQDQQQLMDIWLNKQIMESKPKPVSSGFGAK